MSTPPLYAHSPPPSIAATSHPSSAVSSRPPTPTLDRPLITSTKRHTTSAIPLDSDMISGRLNLEEHASILRPGLTTAHTAPPGLLPSYRDFDSSTSVGSLSSSSGSYGKTTTTLAELAQLVRRQEYQENKHAKNRSRLDRALISNNLSSRLMRNGRLTRTHLVDSFKDDKKDSFAALYTALHEMKDACDRYALLLAQSDTDINSKNILAPTPSQPPSPLDRDSEKPRVPTNFLHELPAPARNNILSFLSELRTNPNFLADRLGKLSSKDLETIVKYYVHGEQNHAAPPTTNARSGRTQGAPAPSANQGLVAGPIERLRGFNRLDPLSTLLHTVFATSSGPESIEDKRRTDIWANACAKIMSEQGRGEPFLFAVFDAWTNMREWPAKGNLELCLMSLLHEGQFLLTEDQSTIPAGKGMGAVVKTKAEPLVLGKSPDPSEEFFQKAVKRVFEVLDNEPYAGGIPGGILEIASAVLGKIDDPKKQRYAEYVIVAKWFFQKFLANTLQYPEYQGMMCGHHISGLARMKILRPTVQRMINAVISVTVMEWKPNQAPEPVIKVHIESMLERFRKPLPTSNPPVLHLAKGITSTAESQDVQPFLVMCPADIATICQALYPPPRQDAGSDQHSIRYKKSHGSISGVSILSKNGQAFDAASYLSKSNSSIASDGTSLHVPLLDRPISIKDGDLSSSPSSSLRNNISALSHSFTQSLLLPRAPHTQSETIDFDFHGACMEMVRVLGIDAVSGRAHPCAEKWAVLYVSADGKDLSLKTRTDWEDDDDDDDLGHDSDSDDGEYGDPSSLDRDYHALKQAVMKLVAEYDIPEEAKPDPNRIVNMGPGESRNPFHTSNLSALFAGNAAHPYQERARDALLREQRGLATTLAPDKEIEAMNRTPLEPLLLQTLSTACNQCLLQGDYISAQVYHKASVQLRKLAQNPSQSLTKDGFGPLIHYFARGARESINYAARAVEELESWFVWLSLTTDKQKSLVTDMVADIKILRDKMWYVTDVRNSAAYESARNIVIALKTMGLPKSAIQPRPSNFSKPSRYGHNRLSSSSNMANISLLKAEFIADDLSSPSKYGGPNKLSPDQCKLTETWLKRYQVQNFCQGEERIHRFCAEIDDCASKLVAEELRNAPVLWGSELFNRELKTMGTFKDAVTSATGGGGSRWTLLSGLSGSLGIGGDSDKARRGSDASMRGGMTRSGSVDYFGPTASAPVNEAAHETYWSPFPTAGAHTSNMSTATTAISSNARPATAHSTTSSFRKTEAEMQERSRFLNELRGTLIGLLLSDLGTEAWSQGSETDSWFSGRLGNECIEYRDRMDAEAAERQRGKLQRKKSTKSIKASAKKQTRPGILDSRSNKAEPAKPIGTYANVAPVLDHPPYHHSGEENSSASDATARSNGNNMSATSAAKKAGLLDFPYVYAFKQLLLRFSTHPSPYVKLRSLYELEQLVVAALTSKSFSLSQLTPRAGVYPHHHFSSHQQDLEGRLQDMQISTTPNTLESNLANVKSKRHPSSTPSSPPFISSPNGLHSSGLPTADTILTVLTQIFKQPSLRPKSLFRDLQFIAAFIPPSILDRTEAGKAFWDISTSVLGLKVDVCKTMMELADGVIAREASGTNSSSGENSSSARYNLRDAGTMFTITAKEGTPAAQRELALLYLTHPNLLAIQTLPFVRTNEIFKPELMAAASSGAADHSPTDAQEMKRETSSQKDSAKKMPVEEKCDPVVLAVAHHWMEMSSSGGDVLARQYLAQGDM